MQQRQLRLLEQLDGQLPRIELQCRLRQRGTWWHPVNQPDEVLCERAHGILHERDAVPEPHLQQRQLRLVERLDGQLRRVELQCGLWQRRAWRYAVGQPLDVRGERSEWVVLERDAGSRPRVQQRQLRLVERLVRKL